MPTKRPKVVESFAPTGGRVLGAIALLIGAVMVADVVIELRTLEGLRIAAITVAVGAVIWAGLVRPSVVAYEHTLVLKNFVRDKLIPWHLVTGAEVSPALTVYTGDERHRSVAVVAGGPDRRALRRAARQGGNASWGGVSVEPGTHEVPSPNPKTPARPPAQHTAHRIETMAEQFREKSTGQQAVQERWAVVEIAVFVVATVVAIVAIVAG
jgi:hypothetical protein